MVLAIDARLVVGGDGETVLEPRCSPSSADVTRAPARACAGAAPLYVQLAAARGELRRINRRRPDR